jgi:hypothetical protein
VVFLSFHTMSRKPSFISDVLLTRLHYIRSSAASSCLESSRPP